MQAETKLIGNDSVTQVTIFGDSARLESRWNKWWLDSTRVTFFTEWFDSSHSQWLETRVRVIFSKSLSTWWTNPVRLHTKKWGFFASVMIKFGEIFCFDCLVVLCFILRIKCTQLA